MLGMLGATFFGRRLFDVTKQKNSKSVTAIDYLVYYDIAHYGDEAEKNQIQFKLLDIQGNNSVKESDYYDFWVQIMAMYGEFIGVKIQFENVNTTTQIAFKLISKGQPAFDFAMFEQARKENPEIFDFLDEPGKLFKSTALNPQKIDFSVLQDYHNEVCEELEKLKIDVTGTFEVSNGKR